MNHQPAELIETDEANVIEDYLTKLDVYKQLINDPTRFIKSFFDDLKLSIGDVLMINFVNAHEAVRSQVIKVKDIMFNELDIIENKLMTRMHRLTQKPKMHYISQLSAENFVCVDKNDLDLQQLNELEDFRLKQNMLIIEINEMMIHLRDVLKNKSKIEGLKFHFLLKSLDEFRSELLDNKLIIFRPCKALVGKSVENGGGGGGSSVSNLIRMMHVPRLETTAADVELDPLGEKNPLGYLFVVDCNELNEIERNLIK